MGSNCYWVFRAIWIKPINLSAASQILETIVSKWPVDQIALLYVANRSAEKIASLDTGLLCIKHRKKHEMIGLKCSPVLQVEVFPPLDNHRSLLKASILQREAGLLECRTARQKSQRQHEQKNAHRVTI